MFSREEQPPTTTDVEPSSQVEVEVKEEDMTASSQHVEKRKSRREKRRKTNSSESSPTNPFKVEPCEEEEEPQDLTGSENVNQKPRVVVPSPPGILFFSPQTFLQFTDNQ